MVNKRNQKLQRKVATIIITDFLCWVPFVFVCFLHFFEVLDATPQYGLFSIVLLPINSVINPFLYSEVMIAQAQKVKTVYRKLSGWLAEMMQGLSNGIVSQNTAWDNESTVIASQNVMEMEPCGASATVVDSECVKVNKIAPDNEVERATDDIEIPIEKPEDLNENCNDL